ncbi:MAG: dienelactone hydrolase family protein [Rhodoferax sp.]|nr:dienelactone hydrolase family protein [Rhodoferax sp.]
MHVSMALRAVLAGLLGLAVASAHAGKHGQDDCRDADAARVRFIEFQSPDISAPGTLLTIKGKLSMPEKANGHGPCRSNNSRHGHKNARKVPAVLILHGSGGVDARGDFYEAAINEAGIATLQIDMWEARGVTGIANRPGLPILTVPDAFSALAFLRADPAIDPDRIGVLGFSWGGVVSLAAAEQLYAGQFGGGMRFAAHVAHYPVCYGANNRDILRAFGAEPAQAGTQFLQLTGAPVLIQVGSEDDYDNGAGPCHALAQAVNPGNNHRVQVQEYPGAFHGWDRLMVPVAVADPFADQGSFLLGQSQTPPAVVIAPDVAQAHAARTRVVRFFRRAF